MLLSVQELYTSGIGHTLLERDSSLNALRNVLVDVPNGFVMFLLPWCLLPTPSLGSNKSMRRLAQSPSENASIGLIRPDLSQLVAVSRSKFCGMRSCDRAGFGVAEITRLGKN